MWLTLAAMFPTAVWADGVADLVLPAGSSRPAASAKATAADDAAAVGKALAAAQADFQRLSGDTLAPGASQEELLERNHLLGHLVDTLTRHRSALERQAEVRLRAEEQQKEAQSWNGFAQSPPYSLLLADQLREALETATVEVSAAAARKAMISEEAEEAEKLFKAAEVDLRQSEERISSENTSEGRNRQTWLRDLARLRSRVAAEDVAEAQVQTAVAETEEAMKRDEARLLEAQGLVARKSVRFSQADLESVLRAIDRQKSQLEDRAKSLAAATADIRQDVETAKRALDAARAEPPPTTETAEQRKARLDLLAQWVDLRQRQSDIHDLAIDGTQRLLELRSWERAGWQFRWYLFNGGTADKISEAQGMIDQRVAQAETLSRYIEREIALSNGRIGEYELRQKEALPAAESDLLSRFIALERERVDLLGGFLQSIETWRRTLEVWRKEMTASDAGWTFGGLVASWESSLGHAIARLWNFELFTAEDSLDIDGRKVSAVRSITVGKSVGVILLLLVGFFLSEWALRGIRRLAINQLGFNAGRTNTVLRWMHFVVLSMLFIVALYTVNIPLTVFAFLGGALAIGIGFGTQVLLKNMISGVMLLVERPLRVGDMIEVGSVVGTVSNISIRSSTVRTSEGIEILVPNSTFIENNVTNWTYSNAKVRRSVSVGIDYAASPERVSEVLLAVAQGHPHVVLEPPPRVLLEQFGSESMGFTLQYWIDYGRGADDSLIASELRFRMAQALAAAGISIPLPQRVIHLKNADDVQAYSSERK
jgi:small-conductance mechanosensitive channel